jgi:hypothetical protein
MFATDGSLRITTVDGTAYTGLFAADGSMNGVIVAADAAGYGIYHPCGALRIVDSTGATGSAAPNGAIYVTLDTLGALTAPVLTLTSGETDDPPSFDCDLTDAIVDDIIWLRWYSDAGCTTLVDEVSNTIDAGEEATQTAAFTTAEWGNGTWYAKAFHTRTGWTDGVSAAVETVINVPSFTTPADLFGVGDDGIWIDFSDATNIFSDAGITQITNGGAIYRVLDKSGNGYIYDQATVADRPAWNSAGYADVGTWDRLRSSTPLFGGVIPNNCTVFVLIQLDNTSSGRFTAMGPASGDNPQWNPLATSFTNLNASIKNSAGTSLVSAGNLATGFWTTSKIIRGITFESGVGATPYTDSTPLTPASFTVSGTVSGLVSHSIGTGDTNGGLATVASDGKYYQLFIINRILTNTEINNLVTYFGTK